MTSKEAIGYFIALCTIRLDREGAKAVSIIEKELKILEILRKHLHIEKDYYDCDDMCSSFEYVGVDDLGGIDLTEEEFNKVKVWLKND